jgi:hypothetical protein
MPDKPPRDTNPATENRPEPPPYRPDDTLIGYIERGQKPPETR